MIDDLAKVFPEDYIFIPTDGIYEKLINRMMQIKPEKEMF
jgi:hypothetical protein